MAQFQALRTRTYQVQLKGVRYSVGCGLLFAFLRPKLNGLGREFQSSVERTGKKMATSGGRLEMIAISGGGRCFKQ
ncbi:hypothetical protein KIM372_15860 [Bombiscardovia nodaiensis]|uniref:Uncharacterized protein n=1 Tax=Bombiscardovia nodaiensis TaxID=2932181 RepID=A0ABM8B9V4_9BIFI|nr:hypothetical protein KIM372_15860 [Bombiscardovia nodaiensis]